MRWWLTLRGVALAFVFCALGACQPYACEEPCDVAAVGRQIAGPDAIDCGVAVTEGERPAVESCMAAAFASRTHFTGIVEIPVVFSGREVILLRGYARGGDGILHELLGTWQPDGAVVRTLAHTRICFAARVEADATGSRIRCTEPMSGLFFVCQCTEPNTVDAGTPDSN